MTQRLDPESIDLAQVAAFLQANCGPSALGAIVGRTLLRDEVVRHLDCSRLEAELIVDTLIARGFVARRETPDGLVAWVIVDHSSA